MRSIPVRPIHVRPPSARTAVPAPEAIGRPWLFVHLAFTLFVASIPFEGVTIGVASVTRLAGWAFVLVSLIQPDVCFRRPPAAFWCFASFLVIFVVRAVVEKPIDVAALRFRTMLLGQLLVVLWAGSNLMRFPSVFLRVLRAFVFSSVLLAGMLITGVASSEGANEAPGRRESMWNEDPNNVGAVLSLAIVAAVGIGYGSSRGGKWSKAFALVAFGVISLAVVRTASRGALVALSVGIIVLLIRKGTASTRIRNVAIVGLGLAALVVLSSSSETARRRWQMTLERGSLAGRERIYPVAFKLFLEKPFAGWGFMMNDKALGDRLGSFPRDTHTTYLWVLTEEGLIGGIPYFLGMYLCALSAWRARRMVLGLVPLALMASLLVVNLSLTWQYRKLHWLVLGLALASARPVAEQQKRVARGRKRIPRALGIPARGGFPAPRGVAAGGRP